MGTAGAGAVPPRRAGAAGADGAGLTGTGLTGAGGMAQPAIRAGLAAPFWCRSLARLPRNP
jgi:hypothetical protein